MSSAQKKLWRKMALVGWILNYYDNKRSNQAIYCVQTLYFSHRVHHRSHDHRIDTLGDTELSTTCQQQRQNPWTWHENMGGFSRLRRFTHSAMALFQYNSAHTTETASCQAIQETRIGIITWRARIRRAKRLLTHVCHVESRVTSLTI